MERYLTDKAKKEHWWDWPVMVLSGLLTAIGVSVIATDANPAGLHVQLFAAALLLMMLGAPLLLTLRRRLRQSRARAIARCLAKCRGESITFGALERQSGVRNAPEAIEKLLSQYYLRNIELDEARGMVRLHPAPAAAPDEPAEAPAPLEDTGIEAFNAKLREIRELNDRIDNAAVSQKIDRIEALTGGIFKLIAQQPDRTGDARRFIQYYLPTTMKLLESYSLMEKQRFQGENITASRKQIEAALDKLIGGIERQQDKLFSSDAMDVEAEIQVLETMMASDGLTERELRI